VPPPRWSQITRSHGEDRHDPVRPRIDEDDLVVVDEVLIASPLWIDFDQKAARRLVRLLWASRTKAPKSCRSTKARPR
jgi:hypothetical protein